ncbi:SPRY-domain-containing protein [Gonapodya prolifera JEL478]|uniref:SPRY-domain-containing protein n=1 Tax=Gonapodya prolifera (strain JEL478) TaxID=1344416 RepID=A0A139AWI3_GONPJ|nr:SPRY-domain-containing protein [Gonapodya prolifera JEL478]|eukprot:KXS21064.1 SPRY-domain-containing protein [Gonapodya prolifera JEL478]
MHMTTVTRGTSQQSAPGSSSSAPSAAPPSSSPAVSGPALPVKYRIPEYLLETPIAQQVNEDNATGQGHSVPAVPLPTAWNPKDKCALVDLSRMNLRVTYIGSGKSDSEAASVRANCPMPPQAGIFYFEVDVLSKGRDGHIGVGFCHQSVSTNRLPGWEPNSWGYHGDDGHSFACSGTGKTYGPTFSTGDVIGCCVNFWSATAFYVKNGQRLEIAFRDLKGTLYPMVGMRTPGEVVEVNFGQRAFKFDIDQYFKEEKAKLWTTIHTSPIPTAYLHSSRDVELPGSFPTPFNPAKALATSNLTGMNDLVLSYLVHHGYAETAEVFAKGMKGEESSQEKEVSSLPANLGPAAQGMRERQRIRDLILAGDIDSAMQFTSALYPQVLPGNPDILFQLKCRKFVEMIRDLSPTSYHDTDVAVGDGRLATSPDTDMEADPSPTGTSTDDDAMEVDDETSGSGKAASGMSSGGMVGGGKFRASRRSQRSKGSKSSAGKKRAAPARSASNGSAGVNGSAIASDTDVPDKGLASLGLLKEAMRYGQQLHDEYRTNESEEVRTQLMEIFSLVAYSEPHKSPVSYLLDISGRETVASALNSAILSAQGHSTMPAMEKIYRQSVALVKELVAQGVGAASFVNVGKDILT